MKEIIFATGNSGKVNSMQRHMAQLKIDISISQQSLELMEPQAETATEVAKAKAKQAFEILKRPVLVDDSSFHIAALGGFPGPYIKYMLSTVGIEGIISFMEGKTDRSAYFLSSLVFVDADGKMHVFEDKPYKGIITDKIDDHDIETAWSDLFKIFIPTGSNKVLARMTAEDHARVDKRQTNSYESFCVWAESNL
jgi:non-canonical purine NTP pyrophosphatase (RdgB/HAM1 family)